MTYFVLSGIFGVFGLAYFVYGKKQDKQIPFWVGLLLMVIVPFISNLYIMISLGILLMILPFLMRE